MKTAVVGAVAMLLWLVFCWSWAISEGLVP